MIKLSNFTLVIPLSVPDEYLLYNTLSETIVHIQDNQHKIIGIDKWDDAVWEDDDFRQLCDLGLFVKGEVNERGLVKKTLWDWRFDTTLLEIRILPTYWCNLDCSYCYQSEFDRSLTMDKRISEQTLNWIEDKALEFRATRLNVKFFGGEVLGRMKLLELFCNRLKSFSRENNIELNFDLTTNGTLLTPAYVNQLNKLGLHTVKVTIDGDEITHNLRRPYANGKGSFRTIINNIVKQGSDLEILLRCNYNQENIKHIPELLDYLAHYKLNEKLTYIEFQPVLLRKDFSSKGKDNHCTHSIYNKEQIKSHLWLAKEAISRGFEINSTLSGGRCPAFYKASFLIDPVGDIYKCPAFLGNPEYVIGNINERELNYLNDTFLMDDSWNSCLNCSYVPICCGGCRYAAKQKFGDFLGKKICEKQYYEKVGLKILELTNA